MLETDYPNSLAEPTPFHAKFPFRPGMLLLLLVLVLVPRALMSWKLDTICPDATLYIAAAHALEQGDLRGGMAEMRLNTFPLVLMLLHRTGLEWELAGKLWCVLLSTFAVLPLFGWLRRQFDDRIAAIAGCLYAVHPMLVQWSPELVRDPTFWFLASLSLYLMWRAVTEVRLGLYAATGVVLLLAALTRVEGLFLLIPLLCWAVFRTVALTQRRWLPLTGVTVCLAVGPLLLVTANTVVLRGHNRWETIRTVPLRLTQRFVNSLSGPVEEDDADARKSAPPLANQQRHTPTMRRAKIYLNTLERGLSPLFALLMLGGIACRFHLWRRGDHQPLFFTALAVLTGMWIHLWFAGQSSTRYPLLIVLVGLPWAALGLVSLSGWLARLCFAKSALRTSQTTAVGILLLVGAIGCADALTNHYDSRQARARLGRWIHDRFGPGATVYGTSDVQRLVAYYARADYRRFAADIEGESLARLVRRDRPQVVILSIRQLSPRQRAPLIAQCGRLGLQVIDGDEMTRGFGKIVILAEPLPHVANQSRGEAVKR